MFLGGGGGVGEFEITWSDWGKGNDIKLLGGIEVLVCDKCILIDRLPNSTLKLKAKSKKQKVKRKPI